MEQSDSRQSHRMKKALRTAFVTLLSEKSYDQITIGDIVERAEVGRSTFYRHYESKIDLLVEMHDGMFNRLTVGFNTKADWLTDVPPKDLVQFLEMFRNTDQTRYTYHRFGKDMTILMRRIEKQLAATFAESLRASFSQDELVIPIPLLGQAVAGSYNWLITAWASERGKETAQELATYAHHLARAMIRSAMLQDLDKEAK